MSESESYVFASAENKVSFDEICEKLRSHPFDSPWQIFFSSESSNKDCPVVCQVEEFDLPADLKIDSEVSSWDMNNTTLAGDDNKKNVAPVFCQTIEKLHILKDSLMSIRESHASEICEIKGIDVLSTLPVSQVSELCKILQNAALSETSVTLFIGALVNLSNPVSISLASAVITSLVYPKVLKMKQNSSRNLLSSILNFSEVYPKSMVDELIVPFLKRESIDSVQLDILLKIVKCSIPNEYLSYSFKSILENDCPNENTFALLQCIIDRKFHCDQNLHNILANTINNWSSTRSNNLKFAKLLVSILTAFSSEFSENHILSYQQTIERNKTIMKKAAENAFKRLKR